MTPSCPQCVSNNGPAGENKRLSLNERLSLIGLIEEGMHQGVANSPIVADLFNDLWGLVNTTASGSKIDRLKGHRSPNGFHVVEMNAETGENLGRLNMLYLKKPVPCYYLVYVEVAAPFRRKGLGNRMLKYFRDFLMQKSAMGILDNIIPREDPCYTIYHKLHWRPVDEITGNGSSHEKENYMIYVPPGMAIHDLKTSVSKVVHHIKRKRAAIDMRDNETMVRQTIAEFKDLYSALLTYFDAEIRTGEPTPLMRFMFTRFVTKLIAFRRRIGELLGYTGGDSLEQIVLGPEIAALPIQSYGPRDLAAGPMMVTGDMELWPLLPDELKERPSRVIEALANYRRPSLMTWLEDRGASPETVLTLGDLMDLGFDPTRLKEITIDGENFIFERIQSRQLPELEKKKELLENIGSAMAGARVRNAELRVNPPLLVIRDRGNAYVLRRRVDGIHWEEAVDQVQSSPRFTTLNQTMKLDRVIQTTVRKATEVIAKQLTVKKETILDTLACFVSWNLESNQPRVMVDFAGASMESVWMA